MYSSNWEPGDRLFLTHFFLELTQVDLRAVATTSQRLAEGARHSKEPLAATTPLPAYVAVTLQANFPWKITFDMLYTNEFIIRVCSRALSISSERNTI